MTPEQRQKHVRTIEKIENMPRPAKWRETKKLLLELHPELVQVDTDFCEAVKEHREKHQSKAGASKSLELRNTMKIPNYIMTAIRKIDPEINEEMSGRNHGDQWRIGKKLYQAFPEYRIARNY